MTPKFPTAFGRVLLVFAAFAAALSSSIAQANKSTTAKKEHVNEDETVKLSPFDVTMTADKGYNTSSSVGAFKTDEKLMEIPQSITVITRDMIDDIGSSNVSDILNFAGVGNFYQGDSAVVRGRTVAMMSEGAADQNFDLAQVDSIAIVKGPAAVLYGIQASLTGMIMKSTRVPMHKRQTTLTGKIDEWGGYRAELDHTGPIGQFGDNKLAYRVDLAYMGGGAFYKNDEIDRISGYAVFELRRPLTTARVSGTYLYSEHRPHRNNFITPAGVPYVGASRDESYLTNDTDTNPKSYTARVYFHQKLADGWDLQARAAYSYYAYYASVMLAGGAASADFQTNEIRFFARRNEAEFNNSSADWTINGKYRLFGRKAETLLGMAFLESSNPKNFFPADPTFARDNVNNGVGFRNINDVTIAVPMNNPQMDKIRLRSEDGYNSIFTTSGRGTRGMNQQLTMFVQQKIEAIPDRLILVGAISRFNWFGESEAVTSPKPATITATAIQRQEAYPYRVGLVFNVIKNLALYATQNTTLGVQNSRLIDGSITPPSLGKLREAGFKTDFLDGRYSATVSAFEANQTNVAVGSGLISPITNQAYAILIGSTNTKGYDFNLAFRPVPNWQLTFTANKVKVSDQNGNTRLAATNTGAWGLFTRYNFTSDALRKFAIGGGANRFYDRWISAGTLRLPDGTVPSVLKLKEEVWAMLFVDYKATRNLTFKVTIDNLFDVLIARGHQSAAAIDIGEPRNVKLTASYRF